jgi:LPS export ABC transporter protein LptC
MTRILLWAVCVGCISCQNEMTDIKAVTDAFNYPVQTTINADYLYTERGNKATRLEAPLLERFQSEQSKIIASKGFRMTFYQSNGRDEEAWLTANGGDYLEKEGIFNANGKVKLMNIDQEYLLTEKLTFYQDSDLIITDDWVTIATKNGMLYGKGLESNSSFTSYHILQPTGKFNVNSDE